MFLSMFLDLIILKLKNVSSIVGPSLSDELSSVYGLSAFVLVASEATPGEPLLLSAPPEQDDRNVIL